MFPGDDAFSVCHQDDGIGHQKHAAHIEIHVAVIDIVDQDLLSQDAPAQYACHGGPYRRRLHLAQPEEFLIGHAYEEEADDEGIPERKLVREVESVPYKIQFVHIHAEEQECEKAQIQTLLPELDRLICNVENNEYHNDEAAADIRKSLPEGQLGIRQQLIEDLHRIVIECPLLRNIRTDVVGVLHAVVRREQHDGCHGYCEERITYRLERRHET